MRTRYLLLLILTVAAGLLVRARGFPAPVWFTKPAGDNLYATAVFWLGGALWPRTPRRWLAGGAMAFCTAIEFLKWSQLPWLVAARHSPLGRLVFGVGFHAENLLWYALGVALALALSASASARTAARPGPP